MNWEKIGYLTQWAVNNSVYYSFGYIGVFMKAAWAFNIFAFLTWAMFAAALLIFIGKDRLNEQEMKPLNKAFRYMPRTLDFLLDFILILVLAGVGHWFYAALVLLNEVMWLAILEPNKTAS